MTYFVYPRRQLWYGSEPGTMKSTLRFPALYLMLLYWAGSYSRHWGHSCDARWEACLLWGNKYMCVCISHIWVLGMHPLKISIKWLVVFNLGGSVVKNPPASAGFQSLGQKDSPGGGNGNPFLYFCLENPMDRGTWQVQSMGSQKSWIQLSD